MHKGLLVLGAAGVLAVFIVRSGDTPAPERAEAAVPDTTVADTAAPAPRVPSRPRATSRGRPVAAPAADAPAPIYRRRDPLTSSLLNGIELSADQETRLDQIRTRQVEQEKYDRQRYAETARQSRGRNQSLEDVAASAARLRQMQEDQAWRQEANVREIRDLLTYEQTPQFDKNHAVWKAGRGQRVVY